MSWRTFITPKNSSNAQFTPFLMSGKGVSAKIFQLKSSGGTKETPFLFIRKGVNLSPFGSAGYLLE
jgi:hypothetical protein